MKYLDIISFTYVWIFSVVLFFPYQICSDLNYVIKIVRVVWCCLGATVDLVVVSNSMMALALPPMFWFCNASICLQSFF